MPDQHAAGVSPRDHVRGVEAMTARHLEGAGVHREHRPAAAGHRPEQDLRKAGIAQLRLLDTLLEAADRRRRSEGWGNVTLLQADATNVKLPHGLADVVTCSYSLTMMPMWLSVIEHAANLLTDDGYLGVVDFYVSHKKAAPSLRQHGPFTRKFWPWWFRHNGVFLNPDHLPCLTDRFEPVLCGGDVEIAGFLQRFFGQKLLNIGRRIIQMETIQRRAKHDFSPPGNRSRQPPLADSTNDILISESPQFPSRVQLRGVGNQVFIEEGIARLD